MNEEQKAQFDEWCVLELFGHQRIAGRVSEMTLAGGAFLRVDVPATSETEAYTRFYNPSAIYSFSPVTEGIARGMAERIQSRPVEVYDLPKLPAGSRQAERVCPRCGRLHRGETDYCERCLAAAVSAGDDEDCSEEEEDDERVISMEEALGEDAIPFT